MSEEIIKVLDALAEKFGLAIDWTSSNVIPYIQQLCGKYVSYEVVTSVVWMVIGLIGICISMWLIKKSKYFYNKVIETKNEDYGWGCFFTGIGAAILILTGIFMVSAQVFDIVTCVTFPEKIIIDELKTLYQNTN